MVWLDDTAGGNKFRYAMIYIQKQMFSLEVTDTILPEIKDPDLNKQALSLGSAYRDALKRFGFLSDVLVVLRKPYIFLPGDLSDLFVRDSDRRPGGPSPPALRCISGEGDAA